MSKEAYSAILAGLEDALAYAKGNTKGAKTHRVHVRSVDVQRVREKLGLSQAEFAAACAVSVATVRNWEQGRREPEDELSSAQLLMAEHDWILRVAAEINPLMGGGSILHGARIGSAERLARGPGSGSETPCSLSEAAKDARMQLYHANRQMPGLLAKDYDAAMSLLDALANGAEDRRTVLDAERLERVQRRILRVNQIIRELVEHDDNDGDER